MRLYIKDTNEYIDLDKQSTTLIIIENKKYFYNCLTNLDIDYSDDSLLKLVDDNYRGLKLQETVDVIYNLFSLDVNNKKNISVVNKQIKLLFKEELISTSIMIKDRIQDCFENICIDYNLDLISDIDFDDEDIVKSMNLKIKDDSITLLEKIMQYIRTSIELRKIKMFIFVSLYTYLDVDEIELLLKNCSLLEVSIINLESHFVKNQIFNKTIIIDKDICLLK